MGGFGSGGAAGTGRKPKSAATARLHGSRQRGGVPPPSMAAMAPEPVPMPEGMTADEAAVWEMLAPHALAARTLTPATAESFRDLCRAITVRNGILAKIQEDGWTYVKVSVDGAGVEHSELKKHPLTADHRGWEQRVEAGRARFRLAPVGKEIAPVAVPDDPFAEFDVQ